MKILTNQRGFMLLNVVFLTLITALAATILMDAAPRIKNPQSVLRLTAIHLANEQFAMLESKAAAGKLTAGNYDFLGDKDDLTTTNAGKPITFTVTTQVTASGNLRNATVTFTIDGDESFELKAERTIPLVPD